jgi:uncharacterized protein YfaS (alpha-2-macroglobulin family)
MAQEPEQNRSRPRILILIALVIVLGGAAAYLIGRNLLEDKGADDGIVIDGSTDGTVSGIRVETEQAVSFAGDSGDGQLHIRLSKGQEQHKLLDALRVVTGTPLSAEAIQQILARLPSLIIDVEDTQDFRLPESVLPPPRPGETVPESFPPPPDAIPPEAVPSGPLEVLRFAPEGEIPLAPFLNVTFNQPMVPLATLEDLAAEQVPVNLTPALPGTWRWLGTKTLTFDYESDAIDRFPMATEYRVEIPAGTRSQTGGVLDRSVSWTFSTPPPGLEFHHPRSGPQPLEPLIFLSFDQLIDQQAVLASIRVEAAGQTFSIRLATDDEIAEDDAVRRMVDNASEGRWLVLRAQQPFPGDTSISVTIGPGTPSAEGPLVTKEAQSFNFHTYAPLRIVEHRCGWSDEDCPPFTPFTIQFNNPLDTEAFDESLLEIDPELPGATAGIFGNTISIRGATKGRTTYRVSVDGAIRDIFGQTLGEDASLRFRVGSAPRMLSGPNQMLVTLDPSSSKPLLTVYSINFNRLRVRAYEVKPSDWSGYKEYLRNFYQEEQPPSPPGREVLNDTISLDAVDDALTETAIDLSDALESETGHLIVIVDPPSNLLSLGRDRQRYIVQTWVQATQIGLDALVDHSEMVVWASALSDGAPLSGLTISGPPSNATAVTGSDGTTRFDLPGEGIELLVAQQGEDTAILPNSQYFWGDDNWHSWPVRDELRWFVFDDRQMYRPGEEVHVKGWLRQIGGKQNGDVGLLDGLVSAVTYRVVGPQGNEFLAGTADVNALGGFDFAFTLPENANLGHANLMLDARGAGGLDGQQYYHSFQIQEFRRPEFEVKASNETAGPFYVGDHAVVSVSANYFAGGPLPNADVTWTVTSSPASYTPPNWSDFVFGKWTPWWFWYGPVYEEGYFDYYGPEFAEGEVETFTGVTDAAGNHYLRIDFDEADEPRPYSVMAEGTVIDVNRQAWAATTSMLVHSGELYVGLRSDRTFVQRGTPLEIEAIVTDVDGNPIPGRSIQMRAARLEWRFNKGVWGEEEVDVQECVLQSTAEPVKCTFETEMGGTYQITASVTDDQGRLNLSQFTRWVSGGRQPAARNVEQETVTLIPDKETYQPGDVAEILVQAPFSPAEGLLTVSRNGILYTERFNMTEGSQTLRVPVAEAHIPNLHVQVDVVGAAQRTDDQGEPLPDLPPRPAYATGALNLNISAHSRSLSLQVDPRQSKLEPGGETVVDVVVTDANGRPVGDAELAVVVVDEAILALTNYQLSDPLAAFYTDRGSLVSSTYGRASIILANPELLGDQLEAGVDDALQSARAVVETVVEEAEVELALAPTEAPAAAGAFAADEAAAAPEPIRVRTDFNPLATFAPAARTDGSGRAQVTVNVPDNLTRYRIMVVAVASGKQFGSAESNLTARLPLMVRPSAPRFLNFGDRFELPIVLQNQTDDSLEVDVVVQAGNVALTGGEGQRVTVPANDRIEVRFPATTILPGTARFQIAAVSGAYADAAEVELPVYTPATTEAFATYGVIDQGAIAQPVAAPGDVFPQFGGLEINTSSTALQALTDAVLYLTSYRYECSEQLASRILAVAALRDVLTAFSAEGLPSADEMEAAVRRDIERLQGLQNGDGGFPIWERARKSIPFYTIHVAHALQRAKLKGFDVPEHALQRVLDYLRDIENHYPSMYSKRTRQSLSAYALYVRQLMGDVDRGKAARLLDEAGLEELSLEAVAWLWQVLGHDPAYGSEVEAIRRYVNNRAVETAGAANFTTSYGDEAYLMLHSNRRTDGVILDALIADQPQSDLIPKVVTGLLAHRTRGRWSNTQENVFILLALDRYFNTFEAETPDFVARIWLGDTYAGAHEFVGRTTERRQTDIPMSYLFDMDLGEGETQDLILSKDGPGRLYYRLGLSYAPTDLDLDPLDMGFIVQRSYEAVDDPEDVYQDENGVWHIKAGARVRVRLAMVASNRRYHVALVDPLPAGLEIVNPALAVSGDIPQDPSDPSYRYGWWWWGTWYEHQNMRDERAEAFATLLWEGVYNYSYLARATTPGEFVVPPAKAEEMYSPEVFGRSGSDTVIVEDAGS